MRPYPFAAAAMVAVLSASCAAAAPDTVPPDATEVALAEIRMATERFQDVEVALAEGYIADPANICETADAMGLPVEHGAMGMHYFRPDLLGITATEPRVDGVGTHTDFANPAILLYEPQADGSMQLVGIENLVFMDAWRAAGNSEPPSYLGVSYDEMVYDPAAEIDAAHGFANHYDRHVWLFRDNPNGVFAQFNPNVTCEHSLPSSAHAH